MRVRKLDIGVVSVDSMASVSKIARAIKINYTSQQLLNVIKKLIIIIFIVICPIPASLPSACQTRGRLTGQSSIWRGSIYVHVWKSSISVYLWHYSQNTTLKFVIEVCELVTYFPLAWSNLNRTISVLGRWTFASLSVVTRAAVN